MEIQEMSEYHNHGCNFYGKLAVVDYQEDWKNNPNYGRFASMSIFDSLEKAQKLIEKKYGKENVVRVCLSIPELVVEIK